MSKSSFLIQPNPDTPGLSQPVEGVNETGMPVTLPVVTEKPITLFLNQQEIVTSMTLGDWVPELAVGYFLNQNMLQRNDEITGIDVDDDLGVVIVRTAHETDFEAKMKRKIRTSGCAEGTAYGDMMERFDEIKLDKNACFKASWLIELSKAINTAPSLYLSAGAIHGCVLCQQDQPLVYMEDIGRHNAVDKIAGWMFLNKSTPHDKVFYTTGRLTTEMVIKTVQMQIPILVSRSGFTAAAVDLARESGLTLIGRARGKRFIALSGIGRIVFDSADAADVTEFPSHQRAVQRDER
ncbi:formate dehydrogenase accessory sulfurtransferase FdhD [Candidatus Puniceispirillum sp.]|nr:formate dehydrogenase accessory sulfurtransferase FdhD [Candidatus Puniceispirillum sp.]